MITVEYVRKYLGSWERRHDSWVSQYLSALLDTDRKTMSEIRLVLKDKIPND